MRRTELGVDWKGLSFFIKLAAFVLFVGVAGSIALHYAATDDTPPSQAIAVVEPATEVAASVALSTTTPQRVINALTIDKAVPSEGKFVAADLVHMQLFLYENGAVVAEYPILTKGRPGTAWETPGGVYAIQSKEKTHFSTIGHVYMPYSMQFYGNYFIHGWTYYPDGTPVAATFSGGCIKLSTEDAQKAFDFADIGTKVFVYDAQETNKQPLTLVPNSLPTVQAPAYLVADIDTGDVYAEQNAQQQLPVASVTKLVTALVANETISLNNTVTVPEGALALPQAASTTPKTFLVDDLFYPLLMQSSDAVADSLAAFYGKRSFVRWMNATARALDMTSTTFTDPSGTSSENVSTPDDLYRLAVYLANKKSFVLKITHTPEKIVTAIDGTKYTIQNMHTPVDDKPFIGGYSDRSIAGGDTMLSVLSLPIGGETRRVAVIILQSQDRIADTESLIAWLTTYAAPSAQAACVSCTDEPDYRKIEL